MWKTTFQFFGLTWLAFFLTGCGGENTSSPSYNPAVGPFDENGNYVEAWADNPPKKRWFKRNKDAEPTTKSKAKPKPAPKKKYRDRVWEDRKPTSKPKPKAKKKYRDRVFGDKKPALKPKPNLNQWPPSKSQPKAKAKPKTKSKPKPRPRPKSKVKPKPRPKPKAKPKSRPKPKVKKKPKRKSVKVKPKYRYHRVKKSDTLWGLSRRYGTSVSAIKKANGLRSNTIITGSTIKIPR